MIFSFTSYAYRHTLDENSEDGVSTYASVSYLDLLKMVTTSCRHAELCCML